MNLLVGTAKDFPYFIIGGGGAILIFFTQFLRHRLQFPDRLVWLNGLNVIQAHSPQPRQDSSLKISKGGDHKTYPAAGRSLR